ncbi:MAG: ATP-grasp domain-containing protein [Flavobacteriales bacterium]|nr:ATP-grasp domain-containing protein [Flavobacteriales bacterium]
MKKSPVLLLGANDRAAFSVAKSLTRHHYPVEVVHWGSHPLKYSKYVSRFYALPDITIHVSSFYEAFRRVLQSKEFLCLLPINDIAVEFCLAFREEIETFCPIPGLNDLEIQKYARDKFALLEKCSSVGISTPATRLIKSLDDLHAVREKLSFPLIAKPTSSKKIISNRVYNFTVRKFSRWAPLEDYVRERILHVPIMLQSVVEGPGVGFNFCSREGQLAAWYIHERITEPVGGGESSYRKTLLSDTYHLYENSKNLIQSLGWTGVGMIEYKIQNGHPFIMELNGRFWGSLELGILSGVDIPYIHISHNLEKKPLPSRPLTATRAMYVRNIRNDFLNTLRTRSLKKILGWTFSLCQHLRKNVKAEDAPWEDFVFRSLLWWEFMEKAGQKIADGFLYKFFNIKGKGWTGNPGRLRTILFVCEGNICRSPFAAYYLKKICPDLEVFSAGLQAQAGKLSPGTAVAQAREFGVDMSFHVSQYILDVPYERADAIFVMDKKNYFKLKRKLPGLQKRIFFLDDQKEIPDPYGLSPEFFEKCYQQIKSGVDTIFRKVT